MVYKNTQPAITMFIVFGLAIALMWPAWTSKSEDVILPVVIIMGIAIVLFSSLTIKIDGDKIKWHFGPRFWRKSLALNEIKSASIIKTKWYYGWGIRLISTGWLYNVSGFTAVELYLKDGTTVSLGTNDAKSLLHAIEKAISAK